MRVPNNVNNFFSNVYINEPLTLNDKFTALSTFLLNWPMQNATCVFAYIHFFILNTCYFILLF